jgi:hypothetical protein
MLDADLLDGHGTGYFQLYDADLAAIAALTGNGYPKRTGPDTWTLDTAFATHSHVFHETPSGSGAGPYTLSGSPVSGSLVVSVANLRQRPKASSPGLNEYQMVAADQFTFGWDPSGLYICCDYQTAVAVDHSHVVNEEVPGYGLTVYLSSAPQTATETLYFNLLRLRRLASGPPGLNEYTISGNTVTLAAPGKQVGDYMTADYLT